MEKKSVVLEIVGRVYFENVYSNFLCHY